MPVCYLYANHFRARREEAEESSSDATELTSQTSALGRDVSSPRGLARASPRFSWRAVIKVEPCKLGARHIQTLDGSFSDAICTKARSLRSLLMNAVITKNDTSISSRRSIKISLNSILLSVHVFVECTAEIYRERKGVKCFATLVSSEAGTISKHEMFISLMSAESRLNSSCISAEVRCIWLQRQLAADRFLCGTTAGAPRPSERDHSPSGRGPAGAATVSIF